MTKTEELKLECRKRGLRYVGTRGNVRGPICLVGEAPGADEDQTGVPFVGAAGRELDRLLREAGVDPADCWWTNPYKVRPPENKLDRISELGIPIQLYIDQFFEELNVYKPTYIASLGATPSGTLLPSLIPRRKNSHFEISKWRGSLLQSPLLSWPHYIVPCFHPAFLFRDWSERPLLLLCLARLQEEVAYFKRTGALQPLPQRSLIHSPSAYDAIDYLKSLMALAPEQAIASDIENIGVYKGKYKTPQRGRLPYVIGFSADPAVGISIGLSEYDKDKRAEIWALVDTVLRTKKLIFQNGDTHDIPWLQYLKFSVHVELYHDTLVRHHVLWPELSHKLEFQTFQYTREPYYKSEGDFSSPRDRQGLKRYNCKDCCVTKEIYEAQEAEFASRN